MRLSMDGASDLRSHLRVVNPMAVAFVAIVVSRILNNTVLSYAVVVAFSLWIVYRHVHVLRFDPPIVLALVTAVICFCVTIASDYSAGSSVNSAIKVICWFLLFYSGYLLAGVEGEDYVKSGFLQIRNVIFVTVFIGFAMQYVLHVKFVTDIVQSVPTPTDAAPFSTVHVLNWQDIRMRSVYSHPIIFADLLLFAMVVTIFLERRILFKCIFLAVFSIALFLTQTRGAWLTLAAFIALQLLVAISKKNVRWNLVVLLPIPIMVCCYLFWSSGLFDQIVDRFLELNTDVSYTQRSGGIEYIVSRFLGEPLRWFFGYGNRASDAAMSGVTIDIEDFGTLDNQWVAALYDFGAIPTLLLAGLCAVSIACFAVSDRPVLKTAAWAGVFLGICSMCFHNAFNWSALNLIFFVSLGFLCRASQSRRGIDVSRKRVSLWVSG